MLSISASRNTTSTSGCGTCGSGRQRGTRAATWAFLSSRTSPRLLEGVSSPKEQTSHRNQIAHWWTGRADVRFRSDLQRNVFEMLRRKFCPKAGRTVIAKDASGSSPEVYYAPFQLLQNVWEWHFALDAVRDSLQKLVEARVELALTSADTPPVTGGIRAAVGFGEDTRSDEVTGRYAQVLAIANAHLPPGVAAIETWALARGAVAGPHRLRPSGGDRVKAKGKSRPPGAFEPCPGSSRRHAEFTVSAAVPHFHAPGWLPTSGP